MFTCFKFRREHKNKNSFKDLNVKTHWIHMQDSFWDVFCHHFMVVSPQTQNLTKTCMMKCDIEEKINRRELMSVSSHIVKNRIYVGEILLRRCCSCINNNFLVGDTPRQGYSIFVLKLQLKWKENCLVWSQTNMTSIFFVLTHLSFHKVLLWHWIYLQRF